MMCAILNTCSVLRPEPGSRVNLIPAHTQGAGVPASGAPVKGKSPRSAQDSISAVTLQDKQFPRDTEARD